MTFVGDPEVDAKVADWLKWDRVCRSARPNRASDSFFTRPFQNEATRKEVEDLVASKNVAELRARMLGRLAFGTAGKCAGRHSFATVRPIARLSCRYSSENGGRV